MSENSQGKPFKTLKLTSMKAADPTGSPADTPVAESAVDKSAKPESTLPSKTEPEVLPKPAASVASDKGISDEHKPEASAKGASTPVSFNLVNLKVGGVKKSSPESESPPPLTSPADTVTPAPFESPVPAKTPPPALSPSAAASAPPGLKPFKFLVPTVTPGASIESDDASANRPQEIKLSKVGSPGLGSVESVPSPPVAELDEAERRSLFALRQSSPPAKPEEVPPVGVAKSPEKASVAKPSARPMVVILVATIALVAIAVGAMVFLFGQKPAATVKPPEVIPVSTVVPVESATTGPTPVIEPEEPNPGASVVTAPRTRSPELVVWLASAKITTIAAQRVTMNDRIYALGAPVNPEKTLRWIGRDSTTKDLLFIDDKGVIYNRPTGGR